MYWPYVVDIALYLLFFTIGTAFGAYLSAWLLFLREREREE